MGDFIVVIVVTRSRASLGPLNISPWGRRNSLIIVWKVEGSGARACIAAKGLGATIDGNYPEGSRVRRHWWSWGKKLLVRGGA